MQQEVRAEIITIVKWAAIIETALVICFVFVVYFLRLFFYIRQKRIGKERNEIEKILSQISLQKEALTKQKILRLKRYIPILLDLMPSLDQRADLPHWQDLRIILTMEVLIPAGKKLVWKKNWFKRYLGLCCLSYGAYGDNETALLKLIRDKRPLISLNAVKIAIAHPTEKLINDIIDVYAKGRRLQQSTFANMLDNAPSDKIAPILFRRISKEKNPYTKAFCYRLLTKLPEYTEICPDALHDIVSSNLDLKIAVLNYLGIRHGKSSLKLLNRYLVDENWQIRAIVATLLGKINNKESLSLLEKSLRDKEWWVRVNSAQALSNMGDEGIAVLKAQNATKDRYAHEAAKYVLLTTEKPGL